MLAAAAAWAVARHDRRVAAAGGCAAIGLAMAALISRRESNCRRDAEAPLDIRLRGAATPGHRGDGWVVRGGCRAVLFVVSGSAPAGAEVAVRGRILRRDDRLEIRDASLSMLRRPPLLARMRERIGRVLDTLYGDDAPLARALVIADEHGVDRDLRDRFADAGIVHMLSVSGLHVAILGEGIALLAAVCGLAPRRVHQATIAIVALYVMVLGAPPPAVRSAVMLGVVRLAALRQRPTSVWAAWALGGSIPLLDPRAVADVGYQLSMAGMAGLLASGGLASRAARRGPAVLRPVLRDVAATTLTCLVTAPVVAWYFGRLSLASPATNLAAAPLFGLAQPALFLSILCAPLPPLAHLVAGGARVMIGLIDTVATLGARIPGGTVHVAPDFATALALLVAAAALVVACASRFPARAGIVAVGAACVAVIGPQLPARGGELELHLLDVGQGDAIALRTPRGRWIVVDAGGKAPGFDAGERTVGPFLRRRGGDVALLVLTHPHMDHVGGVASLVHQRPVIEVWDAARVFGGSGYLDALHAVRDASARWIRAGPGLDRVIDEVRVQTLAPDSTWTASRDDPNTSSVVVLLSYRGLRILLTGDAESDEEAWMIERYGEQLHADILKVGHHGSATSTTPAFLELVHPRVALVSVGATNKYGHPNAEVLRRLDEVGAEVLRTDDDGTVSVSFDGTTLWIRARGERWRAHD